MVQACDNLKPGAMKNINTTRTTMTSDMVLRYFYMADTITAFTYPLYQCKQILLYVGTATWDKETGGKHLAERAERRETHWQVVWSLHHQLQPWKRCIWAEEKFNWQASKEESRLKVSCLKHLPHVRIEGNLYVHTTGKWKGLNIKRLTTAHLFAFFHFYL